MSDDEPIVPALSLSRRGFLAGVSVTTLGGLIEACEPASSEDLVPFVREEAEQIPGVSQLYATAALRGGYAIGVLAESRDGRPIKIEGHPEHPMSLGATGPREQASLLSLYDPDRLRTPSERGRPRGWLHFDRAFGPRSERPYVAARGEGLAVLLPASTSAVLASRLARLRERYPEVRVFFDPTGAPLARWEGARAALGGPLDPHVDLSRAERVVFLDADALTRGPAALRDARGWARRRAPGADHSRCYAFEGAVTCTGVSADERLPTPPSRIGAVALALLAHIAPERASTPEDVPHADAVAAIAADLRAHHGRSVVLVGDGQPAEVHAIGALLNAALGAHDRTLRYRACPILGAGSDAFDLAPLRHALEEHAVDTLVIADANPAYALPDAERFARAMGRAQEIVSLTRFLDETARHASWTLPSLHPLERWGLHRAFDGTPTLAQPMIAPLVAGETPEGLLARLTGDSRDARAAVADAWSAQLDAPSFEEGLARGFADAPEMETATPRPRWDALTALATRIARRRDANRQGLELDLRPDARLEWGEDAENPWLEEMPEPITQLVWGNAALLSPSEMARRELADGDLVELRSADGTTHVTLPALGVPGTAEGTVVGWRGFGRRHGGRHAEHVGVDLGPLALAATVTVARMGTQGALARTQEHARLDHAEAIYRRASLARWRRDPSLTGGTEDPPPTLYPPWPREGPQWGMAIDLGRCTGCSACVVACQAENDVPSVGKTEVALGREMHWLRIDRCLVGAEGEERTGFMPMLCQHCEHAPCEYVCPTNATVHSPDGLNEMVYNRCVGTRFCSNNCPYKVRRFNWFDFHRERTPREQLVLNPDVTVRRRGVMEKCTFCVQRIRRADRYGAGELKTACQQACPTEAIAFGDVDDPETRVAAWQRLPHAYAALGELGTRPRVRYLARIDRERESDD
ncbi:MAG: 4Fe-4S dicluster domain-containing protein [Sandaracinaceae bacterium]